VLLKRTLREEKTNLKFGSDAGASRISGPRISIVDARSREVPSFERSKAGLKEVAGRFDQVFSELNLRAVENPLQSFRREQDHFYGRRIGENGAAHFLMITAGGNEQMECSPHKAGAEP
jgi:hypothetical protein